MTPAMSDALLLLDTTVLIDVLRNRNRRRAWLEQLVVSGKTLAISVITIAEIHSGLRPGEETSTKAQLANLEWIPVSAAIAERAGVMKCASARQGETHNILDLMIAATAMERGCPLATDNQRHFQFPGVTLIPIP